MIHLIFISFLLFPSFAQADRELSRTQILMGDIAVSITIKTDQSPPAAFKAMQQAFDLARKIENEVSEHQPTSQTSQLNQQAGKKEMAIGNHLSTLLKHSIDLFKKTKGAFDITFASRLTDASPTDIVLDTKKSRAMIKRPGVQIGLSGIAKGYIVDQMSASLIQSGFPNHLINAGGDLIAQGSWPVMIQDPTHRSKALCSITLQNQALATSGNYERGDHILSSQDVLSSSIVYDNTMIADALATASFVMKKKGIPTLLDHFPQAIVMAVDQKNRLTSLYHPSNKTLIACQK